MRASRALALTLAAGVVPAAASLAQSDPKAAAARARLAAEQAAAAAQAGTAAAGALRLRGPNGVIDVVRGADEQVLVFTAFGASPTITFNYAASATATTTGGFFETTTVGTDTRDLSAAQKDDQIEAAKARARARAVAVASGGATAPSFVRREIRLRPPPATAAPRDAFATLEVVSSAGGETRRLTLRVDVVAAPARTGQFVDNFRVTSQFSVENAYLAMAMAALSDKPDAVRRRALHDWGFDTDTAALRDLGGEASDGFLVSNDAAVYVVVRGTNPSDVQSWFADAQFQLDPAGRYARSPGARVHRGFRMQLEQDFERLILERVDGPRDRGKPIVVIGHSLGAAVATLAAARLDRLGKPVRAVYAFASPSVGNAEFSADYNTRLGQRHFRVINQEDIIPRLAPAPAFLSVGRLWYIDHKAGHALRALEFDDLDAQMVAYCTLRCSLPTLVTRHRPEEYSLYLYRNLPPGVDRDRLPAPPLAPPLMPQ